MIAPPRWSSEDLERERTASIALFRKARLDEPLEAYLSAFEKYQSVMEDFLEATVDLRVLRAQALEVLATPDALEAFRYLAGPPISNDDLKTLAETASLNAARLRANPELVERVISVVLDSALDRRRFPWFAEEREPSEPERYAAIIASAALMANRQVGTSRRHEGKSVQERQVEEALLGARLLKVPTRNMETVSDAPDPGSFCRESKLGGRKADFVVRLGDKRIMPIECKVSNSATNSVKRLNNDAAVKAESWRVDFGKKQVVPAAVLSGVYKLRNLEDAQERGLHLFWAHDLAPLQRFVRKCNGQR